MNLDSEYTQVDICILITNVQKFRGTVEGLKVEVVDTTGAGDAFCAGILSQLGKDSSVLEASELVNFILCRCFTNILYFMPHRH
jgi:sugar/nucleoside kinase (ribokinase family)